MSLRWQEVYLSRKCLLSGNEAIARGAWEAGVKVACAYPGTPSTEILEALATFPKVDAEWSVNEKISLEVALGASLVGARSIVSMKHVGLNVAADPLFTTSYVGVKGGLVIVVADDPGMYSSQNEQDSRHYARAAKLPMLEPSDVAEALAFTRRAFDLSEEFDTPVLIRSVTRLSHSRGVVTLGERKEQPDPPGFERDPVKYVMLPAHARIRHAVVEERSCKLAAFAETSDLIQMEWGDRSLGFITAGMSYQYLKEVLPHASYLKLGLVWPLPLNKIAEFCEEVEQVYVVEELDPFLETEVRALGHHLSRLPLSRCGELSPDMLRDALGLPPAREPIHLNVDIPARPPVLCPGCPHRGTFYVLRKLGFTVTGDIGCYTLGALPPLQAVDSNLCMGASVGMAFGMEKAIAGAAKGPRQKIAAVIGDSTFAHSGITGLLDVIYNRGHTLTVILDNRTTAMTGFQENPSSGYTAKGEPTVALDFAKLGEALGLPPENIAVASPRDLAAMEETVRQLADQPGPALLVALEPCILHRRASWRGTPSRVDPELCIDCGTCLDLGCPAIIRQEDTDPSQSGVAIDPYLCVGCGLCAQVCPVEAITDEVGLVEGTNA